MAILSIELVTTIDRHKFLDALREEIGVLDGWIADFRFFSNMSAMVSAVLPNRNAVGFARKLTAIGLNLPLEAVEALARQAGKDNKTGEFSCALNITFIHGDGDLRVASPAVPG